VRHVDDTLSSALPSAARPSARACRAPSSASRVAIASSCSTSSSGSGAAIPSVPAATSAGSHAYSTVAGVPRGKIRAANTIASVACSEPS
jgi:hypothetical protein